MIQRLHGRSTHILNASQNTTWGNTMNLLKKKALTITMATSMLATSMMFPAVAQAYNDNDTNLNFAMAADLIFVRPTSLITSALGLGIFVVSAPFSILGGNIGEVGQVLVIDPLKYTFVRPLGHMKQDAD